MCARHLHRHQPPPKPAVLAWCWSADPRNLQRNLATGFAKANCWRSELGRGSAPARILARSACVQRFAQRHHAHDRTTPAPGIGRRVIAFTLCRSAHCTTPTDEQQNGTCSNEARRTRRDGYSYEENWPTASTPEPPSKSVWHKEIVVTTGRCQTCVSDGSEATFVAIVSVMAIPSVRMPAKFGTERIAAPNNAWRISHPHTT